MYTSTLIAVMDFCLEEIGPVFKATWRDGMAISISIGKLSIGKLMEPRVIVVMGVSGCGKSTVGRLVAEGLGCEFVEGDEYHSPDNIAKMRSGRPLEDDDRLGWMSALNAKLSDVVLSGGRAVLSCSALKDIYRVVQLNLIRKLMCLICVPLNNIQLPLKFHLDLTSGSG